jgi:hypothetical protein
MSGDCFCSTNGLASLLFGSEDETTRHSSVIQQRRTTSGNCANCRDTLITVPINEIAESGTRIIEGDDEAFVVLGQRTTQSFTGEPGRGDKMRCLLFANPISSSVLSLTTSAGAATDRMSSAITASHHSTRGLGRPIEKKIMSKRTTLNASHDFSKDESPNLINHYKYPKPSRGRRTPCRGRDAGPARASSTL